MCKSHLQPLGGANTSIFPTTPASKNNASPWLEIICERERKYIHSYKSWWKILKQHPCWSVRCFTFQKMSAGESHLPCFTMSEMERASSTRTLVPTVDEAKPGPQASLCAPMTKYFSKTKQQNYSICCHHTEHLIKALFINTYLVQQSLWWPQRHWLSSSQWGRC